MVLFTDMELTKGTQLGCGAVIGEFARMWTWQRRICAVKLTDVKQLGCGVDRGADVEEQTDGNQ